MKHNLRLCVWTVTCAFGVLCATPASHAAAIAGSMQEAFDYPDATQFINASTLNGGQGWNTAGNTGPNDATANWGAVLNGGSAPFRTATSPGLTYAATGYLPASGNKLTLDGTSAVQNTGRNLGGQTIDSGTTYFSLLMSKNNDTIRTINWAFFSGSTLTERFAIGQIGATAGNSGGNIAMLMNNSNPAGLIQNTTSPIAMGVGITHLLIGRIDWNASGFETVSLWVDPSNVTSEGAAGATYLSTSAFELTSLTAVRPFVGNSATVGGGTVPGASANFDEFRLGGSWESVTSLAVVPEPTSGVLLGLGAISLALEVAPTEAAVIAGGGLGIQVPLALVLTARLAEPSSSRLRLFVPTINPPAKRHHNYDES